MRFLVLLLLDLGLSDQLKNVFLVLFTWFPQFFSGVEDFRADSLID